MVTQLATISPLAERLSFISRVLGPRALAGDARAAIQKLLCATSGSASATCTDIGSLESVNLAIRDTMHRLADATLITPGLRVDKVVETLGLLRGGGAAGASTAGGAASGPSRLAGGRFLYDTELSAALSQGVWQTTEAALTTELAVRGLMAHPNPLVLHVVVMRYPLLVARRAALGLKDSSVCQLLRLSEPRGMVCMLLHLACMLLHLALPQGSLI